MKTQVWVYAMVAVLSLGAGVAIAGVPNSVDRDPTIQAVPDTEPEPQVPSTDPAAIPADSDPASAPMSTDPAGNDPGESAPDTSGSASSTATATGVTTTAATVATEAAPPRDELAVAVANGAEVGGSATLVSDALEDAGYVDVGSFDGPSVAELTIVYFADGFEAAATELAGEMGMAPDLIRPLAEVPDIGGLGSQPLVVYLGRDVVNLSIFQ